MGEVIKVGMADLNICKAPDTITTLGLGSCIGIALLDPVTKIGGLAHIMLPDSTKMKNNSNIAKFADTGIEELLKKDISLILNKDISYNYFVLKLQLLGFEEQMAKDIVYHYYKQLEQKQEVAHPQVFLKKINTLLRQKYFKFCEPLQMCGADFRSAETFLAYDWNEIGTTIQVFI